MLARDARRAVAVNDALTVRAVAQHRVGVALAACHFVLAKLDHLYFRMKRAGVLNRPADLLFVSQNEHFVFAFLDIVSKDNIYITLRDNKRQALLLSLAKIAVLCYDAPHDTA